MGFLLPRISDLTETQYRLLLYFQALVLQHAKATIPVAARQRRRRCRGDGRGHAGDRRQGHHLRASGAIAAGAAARSRRSVDAVAELCAARRARRRRASNGTPPPRCDGWSAWRARRRREVPDETSPDHQLAPARRPDDERRWHRVRRPRTRPAPHRRSPMPRGSSSRESDDRTPDDDADLGGQASTEAGVSSRGIIQRLCRRALRRL